MRRLIGGYIRVETFMADFSGYPSKIGKKPKQTALLEGEKEEKKGLVRGCVKAAQKSGLFTFRKIRWANYPGRW